MEYEGIVKDGVVVLEREKPPEGSRVRFSVQDPIAIPVATPESLQSLREMLLSFAGTAEGGHEDGALQHDHYIYGTPKR